MIIASIDIGTNTALLLIARVSGDGSIEPLQDHHRYPRLGLGVDASGTIHPDAIRRVLTALQDYRDLIHTNRVDRIVVAGTSAVRDATNRDMLKQEILERTGFHLEVLSGEDEAHWTFQGALSGFPALSRATVIDIGGGSMEITAGDRQAIDSRQSINVGSVRMTERFFHADPPSGQDLAELRSFLSHQFSGLLPAPSPVLPLVAVAGTATSLAVLDQGLKEFRADAIQRYEMQTGRIEELCARLGSLASRDIRSLSAVMEGREDIITAGAVILLTFLRQFGFSSVLVSERGLRYGLVLREAARMTAG
ncbi:MAG: Ppx/GppA family phosphatase [Ignavibacteria bacterium]|nr:Ppx/GppA family phosphatase [Ignavibacteria bacterium]